MGLLARISGMLCLVAGAITLLTPIPTGVVLIVFGLGLLVSSSRSAARLLRRLRARYETLDRVLSGAERHLPSELRLPFRRTDPRRLKNRHQRHWRARLFRRGRARM